MKKQFEITTVKSLDEDLFYIQKKIQTVEKKSGSDVSGPTWMLIRFTIESGSMIFNIDRFPFPVTQKEFWVYVPPYSWLDCEYSAEFTGVFDCIISETKPAEHFPKTPIVFSSMAELPTSREDVDNVLMSPSVIAEIPIRTTISPLATRIKSIIDEYVFGGVSMSFVASKLKTSTPVVSREFQKEFGATPTFYKKAIRATYGIYLVAKGHTLTEVMEKTGYNDISRFHKQFSAYLSLTPSKFKPTLKKSRNARTA